MPLAEVVLSMGRCHLRVGGVYLATEGDKCRDGNIPEHVLPPVPPEELASASIGGEPAASLPTSVVRFFRGDNWTTEMMEWAADKINAAAKES